MRIGYVCLDRGIPLLGHKGASNHVREFIAAARGLGHEVEVFCSRVGKSSVLLPFPVHKIQTPRQPEQLPTRLAAEITSLDQNEVLRNTLEQAHAEAPFDVIHERYSLWSFGALEFAGRHRVPYILEVNSPLLVEQKNYRSLHLEPAARAIEELVFRAATVVVGVSQRVADYVVNRSHRKGATVVVPNGVDLDLFSRVTPARPKDGFTIGFVGSLKPWHGLETLMKAFRRLAQESPDYRLLIVGDGPRRSWIEDYARENGLSHLVEISGGVEKTSIPGLLERMDTATAPYPALDDFYFSPLKLFEYMAAGRAIVASRIGQVAEVIRHGQTGLLAEPGSTEELTESIRLLRANPNLRQQLGLAARREAFQHHGWERRVRSVLETVSGTALASGPAAAPKSQTVESPVVGAYAN